MLRVLIVAMGIFGGGHACAGQENCSTHSGGWSRDSRDYCYSARIRSTVLQGLPFGGVPTVLALDFMCFLVSGPWQLCKIMHVRELSNVPRWVCECEGFVCLYVALR